MKRVLCVLLAVICLALFCSGCQKKDDDNQGGGSKNNEITFTDENKFSIEKYLSYSIDIDYGYEYETVVNNKRVRTGTATIIVNIDKCTSKDINCYDLVLTFELMCYSYVWDFENLKATNGTSYDKLICEVSVSSWGNATVEEDISGERTASISFSGNLSLDEPSILIYNFAAKHGTIIIND